jgi:hypothetical protein
MGAKWWIALPRWRSVDRQAFSPAPKPPEGDHMHSLTLNRLQAFEDEARRRSNSRVFLQLLSPLHAQWHAQRTRRVGFLLFHWHVIQHFRALALDGRLGVEPYGTDDFGPGGPFEAVDWTAALGGVPDSESLGDLQLYSRAMEGWHNEAHMEIGMVTGLDLMNPASNVFLTEFWNLHFFIDSRFDEQLHSYAEKQHPGLQEVDEVVEHIEGSHPGTIARI